MAQHDYNIANQSGADFRADLNNALSAIATVNSGASEPSTTFAHQLWVDTSNNVLKIRNAANSAFITTGVSITASNTFAGNLTGNVTGDLTGNATTATTLETARTINGVSFNGSANISFNTDSVAEGSSNLYFTNERVDDRVSTLIQNGTGISWSYDDASGTFTPTISLSPFNTSQLSESGNLYYTDARARAAISENSAQLSYNSTTGVLTYTQGDTDTVSEGSNNLYYTSARANTDFDTRLATKSTSNLAEGTNLYYTTARFDSAFTSKDTDDLSEGTTNLYYTQARFDSAFGNKTTANLTENTNLYYTDTRANSAIDARVVKSFVDALGIQAASVADNSVVLGNDTTGNYIQTVTGTANKITVSGSGSESADITLSLPDDVQIASDLTVAGNLTVNGTLTSLDTTNLDIEDNLFQLNAGLTGSPVNDSGMLINRGNQNNGIFMWDESVDKFTLGLTTADGTSTGNITLASLGTLVANVEGDVTGNVSGTAATVTGAAQPNITSLGTLTGLTTTGDINFGDNDKAIFGAGSDLQIYHDGSNSFIKDAGTGSLLIDASNLYLRNSSGEEYASFIADGAANLKYNGSTRIVTTSTGLDVTGTATMDGLTVESTLPTITLSETDDSTYSTIAQSFGYLQISADAGNTGSGDGIVFKVDNSEAARIDASGNFYVGTTDTTLYSATSGGGIYAVPNGSTTIARQSTSSTQPLFILNETGVDGTLQEFRKDGTTVGVIGTENWGIGTDSPSHLLDLRSTTSPVLNIQGGDGNSKNIYFRKNTGDTVEGRIKVYADIMSFETGGSEALRIDSNQNVGIGTTSPTGDGTALHIHGSTHSTLHLTNSTTGSAVSDGFDIITDGLDALLRNREDAAIKFRIGSSEVLRMNSTGVGIGTSPSSNLDVRGSGSNGQIYLGGSTSATYGKMYSDNDGTLILAADAGNNAGSSSFRVEVDGGEKLRLDSSGRLGIGLTSPTSPLTIKSSSVSASNSGMLIQANGNTNNIIAMGEKSTDGGRFHMYDGGVEKIAFYTDGTANHISAGNFGIGDEFNSKWRCKHTKCSNT